MGIPGLQLDYLDDGDIVVFTISGEVSRDRYDEINEFVQTVIRRGAKALIGDCSRAGRISSTGVGMMAYYCKEMRERGGHLVVVRPPDGIMKTLSPSSVERFVPFFDTLEDALKHVRDALTPGQPARVF